MIVGSIYSSDSADVAMAAVPTTGVIPVRDDPSTSNVLRNTITECIAS